jgi:N-acetylglucosaminyl-diphospho-decaprenol L-rhamnosyltransferase
MTTPELCVYIPNLDGGARLRRTLGTLAAQTMPAPVVVIDNGSRDDSPVVAEREFGARVIRLEQNIGFGRALNLGVAECPAERLVFLNNDVECEPQLLEALVEASEAADTVAGVLLQLERADLIDSAGVVADRTLLAWDYLHGAPVEEAAKAAPPLGPTGGAALVKRDIFERVGGFDERIFAYLEDLDLALRIRCAGGVCALAPNARALHVHSSTLGSGSAAKNRLMGWSRGYLLRRYGMLRPALVAPTLARGGDRRRPAPRRPHGHRDHEPARGLVGRGRAAAPAAAGGRPARRLDARGAADAVAATASATGPAAGGREPAIEPDAATVASPCWKP